MKPWVVWSISGLGWFSQATESESESQSEAYSVSEIPIALAIPSQIVGVVSRILYPEGLRMTPVIGLFFRFCLRLRQSGFH